MEETVDWEAHYLPDVEYLVWYRPWGGKPDSCGVEFQAVEVVGFNGEGNLEGWKKGWEQSGDWIELDDREGSAKLLEGYVKWDGCSNIDFDNDGKTPHFCGRKHATNVGVLLDHIYTIAAEFHLKQSEYFYEKGYDG